MEKGTGCFQLNRLLHSDRSPVKPINNIIKKRRRLTSQENIVLNQVFDKYPRPPKAVKELIAKKLGMSMRCIQIWFQNRRAKAKKDTQFDPEDQLLCYVPQQTSDGSSEGGSGRSSGGGMFGEFQIACNPEFLSSISAVAPNSPILNTTTASNAFNTSPQMTTTFASKNTPNINDKNERNPRRLSSNISATSSSSSVLESEISLFSPGLDPLEFTNCNNFPGRLEPDYFALKATDPESIDSLLHSSGRSVEFKVGDVAPGIITTTDLNDSLTPHFNFEDYLNL